MIRIILTILFLFGMNLAPAYAGAGIPNNGRGEYSGALPVGTNVVKAMPGLVYSMTILASASNATLTIFDNSTTNTGTSAYEVGSATSGNAVSIDMSAAPLNLYQGITAVVTNGTGFINYQ